MAPTWSLPHATKLADSASSLMVKSKFKNEPKTPHKDSLWQAGDDGDVRGPKKFIRRSAYTAAIVNPLASLLVIAGAAGAGIGIAAWKRR